VKRRSDIPLQKVTLNLFDGDMSVLQEHYPRIGGSIAVRALVRKHVNELLSAAAERRGVTIRQLDLPVDLVSENLAAKIEQL
jgi:hypothetical protein